LTNSPPLWWDKALNEAWTTAEKLVAAQRKSADFVNFQKKYSKDPAAFVVDCIEHAEDRGPIDYQMEILEQIPVEKRVSVRGPHGMGKTALASWLVLWGVLTADDCKVPTTASAWRQLTKFLWPEVHKWAQRLRWGRIGREPFTRDELLTLSLKRNVTVEAFAVASDNPALIEGAHAERIVYVYDEAKSIGGDTFDASEGAFATAGDDTAGEAFALAISTPGEPQGRFYDIHRRAAGYEDWWVRHVTLDEAIAAGRISRQWADQRRKQWGEASAVYQNRVLGEFASSGTDGVIPLAWVEAANERWHAWVEAGKPGDFFGVGVDVGGGGEGGDATVEALGYGEAIIGELRKHPRGDPMTATMQTVGRVKGILDAHGGVAVVDVIGIGTGVVHRLREQGLRTKVLAFNAGAGTKHKEKSGELGFADLRSAGWWIVREMLEPGSGFGVALPPDDELTGDLTAPHYTEQSGGRIKVESKKEIKKRLKRSTDCGDAVMMLLARQLVKSGVFFA
jgi:hypothetical protein